MLCHWSWITETRLMSAADLSYTHNRCKAQTRIISILISNLDWKIGKSLLSFCCLVLDF